MPSQGDSLPRTGQAGVAVSGWRDMLLAPSLGLAGLIHVLPLPGVLGAGWLQKLYGLTLTEPNLLILLQHRAVLFALLGVLLFGAIRIPVWRPIALAAGLVSTISFLAIALGATAYNAALQRIVLGDVVALAGLVVATALHVAARAHRATAS